VDEFTKRRIEGMAALYGQFDLTNDPFVIEGLAEVYQTTLANGDHVMRFYHPGGARKGVAAIITVGHCYIVAHVRGVSLMHATKTFQAFIGADTKQELPDGWLVGSLPDIDALPPCQIDPTDCNDHWSDNLVGSHRH